MGGVGQILEEYPWIPALAVGCSMAVFLSLSFYSHHRRVRRKRELLMDYVSTLLYSGAWDRGRSVSVLCNTHIMTLSDLTSSFKVKASRKPDQHPQADFLREKYLMDLFTFSDSNNKKGKKGLKRFTSAPSDTKFRRMASQLMAMNRVSRLGRGGLATLARNFSMPGEFDVCDMDVPESVSEAKANITQGVLLDPNRMPRGTSQAAGRFRRAATVAASRLDHSYENLAFTDHTGDVESGPHPPVTFSVGSDSRQSLDTSDLCRTPTQLGLDMSASPPTRPSHLSDIPRHDALDREDTLLLPVKDVSVSVTRSSAAPPSIHTTSVHGTDHCNMAFTACLTESGWRAGYATHGSDKSRHYVQGRDSVLYTAVDGHCGGNSDCPFSWQVAKASLQIMNKPRCRPQSNVPTNLTASPTRHGMNHFTTETVSLEDGLLPRDLHTRSLDEIKGKPVSPQLDSRSKCAVAHAKSLEDGLRTKSPGRYPLHHRVDTRERNLVIAGENGPPLSALNPATFLPTALGRPLLLVTGQEKQTFAEQTTGIGRAPKLASTKALNSKLTRRLPGEFSLPRVRSKASLGKMLSTQSTKSLISGTGTPPQAYGSLDSDGLPSTPPYTIFSLQQGPETHNHDRDLTHTLPQQFFGLHEGPEVPSMTASQNRSIQNQHCKAPALHQSTERAVTANHSIFPLSSPNRSPSLHKGPDTTMHSLNNHDQHDRQLNTDQLLLDDKQQESKPEQAPPSPETGAEGSRLWQASPSPSRGLEKALTLQPLTLASWEHPGTLTTVTSSQDTVLQLSSMTSFADGPPEVQHSSNLHRLPRFQVRSGLQRDRRLLLQHSLAQTCE